VQKVGFLKKNISIDGFYLASLKIFHSVILDINISKKNPNCPHRQGGTPSTTVAKPARLPETFRLSGHVPIETSRHIGVGYYLCVCCSEISNLSK